jgi:hypothetical protein
VCQPYSACVLWQILHKRDKAEVLFDSTRGDFYGKRDRKTEAWEWQHSRFNDKTGGAYNYRTACKPSI